MNNPLTKKETILIVDDVPENLRLLSTMLDSSGYEVKKAINAKFALQVVKVVCPDLILLDINMPELNGYEVCQALKSQPETSTIPIIFISGFNEVVDKVMAFEVGGVDYITKPFHWKEVLVRVENQLNQQRLYKQLQQKNKLLENILKECEQIQTELIQANKKLENLALVDGLTGVANRRQFNQFLHYEWGKLYRDQLPLSLILCDVDFFKDYNDTYGHLAGDHCLQNIANTIKSVVHRSSDLVARYGGEEFAIILPNTGFDGAKYIGESIRKAVYKLKIPHAKSRVDSFVTISAGINTIIPNTPDPESLIAKTDDILYLAKKQGRNRIVCAAI